MLTITQAAAPSTCALLAQVVPVFFIAFTLRGSFVTSSSRQDVERRPRRARRRHWLRDPRIEWATVVVGFIVYEFVLVLGAAEVIPLNSILVLGWFALTLLFATIEAWAAGIATRPTCGSSGELIELEMSHSPGAKTGRRMSALGREHRGLLCGGGSVIHQVPGVAGLGATLHAGALIRAGGRLWAS